ncbi:TraR/DksA family transcriptional regulator [Veronia pacifica]|uniref:Molecular chaperone DnaK n=1 Tax=Veronia pacifica TaxID=1080227 RepID=A0A1C3EIK1_9GAMM|nr:TraR/DksA family transcriptional regulator [Veronia pacifica]ODA33039.1 molecular chaperone DnaK [Veronia pacifica]
MTDYKSMLETLRVELEDELHQLADAAQEVTLDQQSFGRLSRMDAIQQQEMAKSNMVHVEQRLKEIAHALLRLEEDDYGYCESCGEDISEDRLRIKPEANLCISCQSKLETKGSVD